MKVQITGWSDQSINDIAAIVVSRSLSRDSKAYKYDAAVNYFPSMNLTPLIEFPSRKVSSSSKYKRISSQCIKSIFIVYSSSKSD
jgi:hypothetical protein